MPDYNRAREAMGLSRVDSWANFTSDPEIQSILETLYPDGIDTLDPYIGGLLERASLPSWPNTGFVSHL